MHQAAGSTSSPQKLSPALSSDQLCKAACQLHLLRPPAPSLILNFRFLQGVSRAARTHPSPLPRTWTSQAIVPQGHRGRPGNRTRMASLAGHAGWACRS